MHAPKIQIKTLRKTLYSYDTQVSIQNLDLISTKHTFNQYCYISGTPGIPGRDGQARSLAEISTPSRDPDTNLSPAQTSATYWVATWLIDHAMPCHALNVYSIHIIVLFNLTWTSHLDRYEENVLMAYSLILSCGFDSRENTISWSFELINSGILSNSSLPN